MEQYKISKLLNDSSVSEFVTKNRSKYSRLLNTRVGGGGS